MESYMDTPQRVKDEGSLHHYRIELPNLIDDMDMSVYAFRLYAHLKRRAGDHGDCWEGTRKLAASCRMSLGQVSKAKKELIDLGLITITKRDTPSGPGDEISIIDIWPKNFDTFKRSPHERFTDTSVHHTNASQLERSQGELMRSQGEHEEEPVKKNHEESSSRASTPARKRKATSNASEGEMEQATLTAAGTPSPNSARPPSPHQAMMQAYAEALGYPIRNGGKEAAAAKWLIQHDYTPDQVVACYESLKADPFWSDKHLSLQSLSDKIGAWVQRQQRSAPTPATRQHADETPEEKARRLRAYYDELQRNHSPSMYYGDGKPAPTRR
jgi:hypothetical protein